MKLFRQFKMFWRTRNHASITIDPRFFKEGKWNEVSFKVKKNEDKSIIYDSIVIRELRFRKTKWRGYIDDLKVYDRPLTKKEIIAISKRKKIKN